MLYILGNIGSDYDLVPQVPCHYLKQCWPSSMESLGVCELMWWFMKTCSWHWHIGCRCDLVYLDCLSLFICSLLKSSHNTVMLGRFLYFVMQKNLFSDHNQIQIWADLGSPQHFTKIPAVHQNSCCPSFCRSRPDQRPWPNTIKKVVNEFANFQVAVQAT